MDCLYLLNCQAEGWIEDKLKIAKEESFKNVRDIQDKMKSLKKHQAFEAEIMANADRIRAIKQVTHRHHAVPVSKLTEILLIQFQSTFNIFRFFCIVLCCQKNFASCDRRIFLSDFVQLKFILLSRLVST